MDTRPPKPRVVGSNPAAPTPSAASLNSWVPTQGDTNRFWAKVAKGPGCWSWVARRDRSGYGQFAVARRPQQAHRVSWLLARGPLPPSPLVLRHRCGVTSCVNPDHLEPGTPAENCGDTVRHGKTTCGQRHPLAKLTVAQAAEIARRRRAGESSGLLAREFGVDSSRVRQIARGDGWPHLTRTEHDHLHSLAEAVASGRISLLAAERMAVLP